MKNGLFLALSVVLFSCSRTGDNETPKTPSNPEVKTSKKITQIYQDDKIRNAYLWEDDKLIKREYYKDGFLEIFDRIYYNGNLMKTDSTFSASNEFKSRRIFNYNSDGNLSVQQDYKVGYIYEKRLALLNQLNEGYINQEEYRKGIDKLKELYSPSMLDKVSRIPYLNGTRQYTDALIEIEKSGDVLYRETYYSYDSRQLISEIKTIIDKKEVSRNKYTYSEDQTHFSIKTTYTDTNNFILANYVLDKKVGVYHKVQANKADWFYNTLERKLGDKSPNLTVRDFDYTYTYTYDNEGYPIKSTYTIGGKNSEQTYIWK